MSAGAIDAADLERLRAELLQANAAELAALRLAAEDALQVLQNYRHLVQQHAPQDLACWDRLASRFVATEWRRAAAVKARQAWRHELHRTLGWSGDAS